LELEGSIPSFCVMEQEKKIAKLVSEYKRKLMNKENEIAVLLIDFAREYNEIWRSQSN